MKATLEQFIDPVNIPKKYGGQLEFQFGDYPVIDPAIEKVVQWEGDFTRFPLGPKYWVHGNSEHMEAIAVGTVDEKERRVVVCTLKKLLGDDEDPIMTRTETTRSNLPRPVLPAELLDVPTEPPSPASGSMTNLAEKGNQDDEEIAVGTEELKLDEGSEGNEKLVVNGVPVEGPHSTTTANKLHPDMNADGVEKVESAHKHEGENGAVEVAATQK